MFPPAPGKMPMNVPRTEERMRLARWARTFFVVSQRTPFVRWYSTASCPPIPFDTMFSTSGMQNSPIRMTIRSTPPCMAGDPKVNRTSPPIGAMPMVETRMPNAAPTTPLRKDPADRLEMMVNPKTPTQKYSAGPNRRAISARGGARKMRAITPKIPPNAEPTVAATIASSPLPCRAIGYPSKVVPMELGVPGVLIRMALNAPP